MKRREFIALLGGAAAGPAVLWACAARAQQPAMPVIGYLGSGAPRDTGAARVRAFRQGLSETGYVEGRNVLIEYRWGENQQERLPVLAADLVRWPVTVFAAAGISAAAAAKAATTTIPIVFNMGQDPVERGFVASLSRPGGNLTGVSNLNVELGPKRLELIRELVPAATIIALLVDPTGPNAVTVSREMQTAAHTFGLQLHVLQVSSEGQFDAVFATLVELRTGALVIGNDGLFINRVEQLGALTRRHAVPTIFQFREFAAAGGLMSYGDSLTDPYRLAGIYTGRILNGEKPADLPVQQSTKVELVINLKTAKALGVTFPLSMLGRADEVIE
jgi:putative ABC transport system substrate-binding protein